MVLSRRAFTVSLLGLPACTAIGSLNDAATPRDTFQLQPVISRGGGTRSGRRLLVVTPSASAAIATDRILVRDDPLEVSYLADARWSEALPQMLELVFIQSVAGTGRLGYVGSQGAGPVPDVVLLTRIDRFDVTGQPDGELRALVDFECTLLRDSDQRVLATQSFAGTATIPSATPDPVVRGFQAILDGLLPELLEWLLPRV